MPSKVEICNLALGWLGASLVHDLDADPPESAEAELCAALYDAALRSVLEAKAWTFATSRVALEPGAASGVAEYPTKLPLPATVLRVLEVDDGTGDFALKWVREGDQVLVDDTLAVVYAKAIVLAEDPLKYPPGFARALAFRLAADLAVALTEKAALAASFEERYLEAVARAGALDGAQGSLDEPTRPTTWLDRARRG